MSTTDKASTETPHESTEQAEANADAAAGAQLSTAPLEDGPTAPVGIGVIGWARWFWRQLTSMRVALILLFLLSLGSIPGSLIPQTQVDAMKVAEWKRTHDFWVPVAEKLQLFDVYSSVWFSAIYILLFVSLIGCIIPRTWQFVGQLTGRPPGAPGASTGCPRTRRGARRSPRTRCSRTRRTCSAGAASAPRRTGTPWPPRRATCARPATWPSTSP